MTKPQLNIPLKACPFAHPDEIHEVQVHPVGFGSPEHWEVACSCGACGPTDLGESGACEAWNTRPLEAQLLEACKAMEEWADKDINFFSSRFVKAMDLIAAAIAAAEGAP